MIAEQWFYRIDGRVHGPFTAVQFDKLIRGRTVRPATEVSMDGKKWGPLQEVLSASANPAPQSPASDWMTAQTLIHPALPPDKKAE